MKKREKGRKKSRFSESIIVSVVGLLKWITVPKSMTWSHHITICSKHTNSGGINLNDDQIEYKSLLIWSHHQSIPSTLTIEWYRYQRYYLLDRVETSGKISNNIFNFFNTNRQTDHVVRNTQLFTHFWWDGCMGHDCWVFSKTFNSTEGFCTCE